MSDIWCLMSYVWCVTPVVKCLTSNVRCLMSGALSIQQKFRFEISEIPRAQWNGTFWLHRPDTSHCASGYCSWKQDTKERYWEQQFCQIERDISVPPTEMTRPVTVDHLQSWSQIFRTDQTEIVCSIWCTNRSFRNFGLNEKCPRCPVSDIWCLIYDAWCLLSGVWCFISYVWCLEYDVRCLKYYVRCLMSKAWCETSDVSCIISDVWCLLSGVWCLMSYVWSLVSDIWC